MKNKLIKTMMIVLFIQVILFGIAIFGGNTIQSINDEYLNMLDNRVLVRKNDLEDEMLQRWSNIMDFEEYMQKEIKSSGVMEDLSLIPDLLEDVADQIVFYLRQTGVTEIFVILDGEKGQEGLYLRDLDPYFNANDNSDILMERGSMNIAQKLGVALDSEWSSKFNLKKENKNSDFYFKPYDVAELKPDINIQDLGYWSKPFKLSENDIEVITYSLPLRDEKGEPCGVLGVGLTSEYLSRKLKYDELADNKRGFYILNIYDRKTDRNETAVSSGPLYNIFSHSETNSYEKMDNKNIYKIKDNEKIDGIIYASSQDLNLYTQNSPYSDEIWSVAGFVERRHLFKPIRKITTSVLISLLISLIVGISAVYISGTIFMKPINKLMKSIMESNPDKPLNIERTNIQEVDNLGLAIVSLNNEVLDSASKLSRIINMVNMPIGAFEYTEDEYKAFCTDTFFHILGIKSDKSINYVDKSYLVEMLNQIRKHPEKDIENIYSLKKSDGKNSFVKLIIQENKGKVLGVIEDVTEDIVSKRKMEYERDHDVLTYLLNRRAFESIVKIR